MLFNLISNAIRYTPEGGNIVVCVNQAGRFASISVTDTGVGLAPDELTHIFERFYRVDKARTRRSGGSGIGLTIAQRLAWAMGGEITVRSEGVGHGSTFGFTLPLASTHTPAPFTGRRCIAPWLQPGADVVDHDSPHPAAGLVAWPAPP